MRLSKDINRWRGTMESISNSGKAADPKSPEHGVTRLVILRVKPIPPPRRCLTFHSNCGLTAFVDNCGFREGCSCRLCRPTSGRQFRSLQDWSPSHGKLNPPGPAAEC